MYEAVIDTEIFKRHSTRSDSASVVKLHGVEFDKIMGTASWRNAKTFAKYYYKPIASVGFKATDLLGQHSLL